MLVVMAGHEDAHAREPRVGEPLPASAEAHIDRDKLSRYALDPEHPVGRHKALVFRKALGIEPNDWQYLRDSILAQLPHQPITGTRPPTGRGGASTWEVLVPIQGLRAQSARYLLVITAWEMVEGRAVLVTVQVAPRHRQEPAVRE